jgi:phage terminase Nu1 subunit (DNA packaging protein)
MARKFANKKELAQLAGITERQITNYCQAGMPRIGKREYDVDACLEWIRNSIKNPKAECRQPAGDRNYWETYKVREQALQEELKRKQLEGELIEVDVVSRIHEQRITHAKALLDQIPERCISLLPKSVPAKNKKEIRERLAQMIDDLLTTLADNEFEQSSTPTPVEEKSSLGTDQKAAPSRMVSAKHKTTKRNKQQSR